MTGGIKTEFFENIEPYDFPKDSLYSPARDELESAIRGDTSKAKLTSTF